MINPMNAPTGNPAINPGNIGIWAQQPSMMPQPIPMFYGSAPQPQSIPNWNQPVSTMPQQNAMNQPQQQGQQSTNPAVPCRVINSIDDVRPTVDVPMDGSISLFVTSDLSKVYAKQWNKAGSVDTAVFYRSEQSEGQTNQQNVETPVVYNAQGLSQIMDKLDELTDLVNSKMSTASGNAKKTTTKKEESVNE